ncbi:MAG: YgfZ/GcvT domain-containing protein [Thermodesulfobacteriota bacterium]
MINTPLFEFEKSLNANFEIINEWQLPKDYGNCENEVNAARNGIAFSDISNRGKLKLTGRDHLKLLQGMLTNDVLKLESGKGNFAAILTNKGKTLSDMRVFKDKDSVFLDLEPKINEKIKDHLLKFRLSYKAEIEDITHGYGLIHIFGPECPYFIESFMIDAKSMFEYNHTTKDGIKFMKINRTGETGFDILFENQLAEKVSDMIIKNKINISSVGSNAFETMRIEAGIPKYNKDFDERTIPIEAELWQALDFEKGCYVGQEVVARIKWRGRVNRHLVCLIIEGDKIPEPKDKLFSGEKEIGKITSAVFSPTIEKIVALGYIRKEFKDVGTKAEILLKDGSKTTSTVLENPVSGSFS